MPSRAEFQTLSNKRLDEARTLHGAGHHEAAFYLAGYAVECGLKAAVCKTLQIDIFEKQYSDFHNGFKIHRLDRLIVLSGLSRQLAIDAAADPSPLLSIAQDQFVKPPSEVSTSNWQSWSEQVRYNVIDCDPVTCKDFIDNVERLMSWLKKHW